MILQITTEPSLDHIPWLVSHLRASYWGHWLTEDQIRAAVKNSLCFWAFHYEAEVSWPVGFARVVTDGRINSFVTDLFVLPEERRKGIARAIMNEVLNHEQVRKTICILQTQTSAAFYRKCGFHDIPASEGSHMRRSPPEAPPRL